LSRGNIEEGERPQQKGTGGSRHGTLGSIHFVSKRKSDYFFAACRFNLSRPAARFSH
jgi:hypothetical protein